MIFVHFQFFDDNDRLGFIIAYTHFFVKLF